MQELPTTSPVRTTILSAVSQGIIFHLQLYSRLGLINTRVSEVMNLSRQTVGRAKSEETRNFGELLMPLISRDKMSGKQDLLLAYFKTIADDPESTKSGIFSLYQPILSNFQGVIILPFSAPPRSVIKIIYRFVTARGLSRKKMQLLRLREYFMSKDELTALVVRKGTPFCLSFFLFFLSFYVFFFVSFLFLFFAFFLHAEFRNYLGMRIHLYIISI